jgi:hypothetical protein
MAATPLFDCEVAFQSGVALRFPPHSKIACAALRLSANTSASSALKIVVREIVWS